MANSYEKKTCFVVMPFGEKTDIDGKKIDFDKIYKYLIKKTLEDDLKIKCIRCDEIAEAGWIHSKMFEHIYQSDICLVDITSLNPNVFYELGVRHALADSVTVIIRRIGTEIPFNIKGFQVIEYSEDMESVDIARHKIGEFIKNGLKCKRKDSPVYEVLDLKIGTEAKRLKKTEFINYKLKKNPKKMIGLITGDLIKIKGIDVWVSSENTNMQMARHFDRSISSVIRYFGAKRNQAGNVEEDIIADELAKIVGNNFNVPAGTVIVTGAGELEKTHGVKKIFHAATVVGQVGKGYTPIGDIKMCVRNALEKVNSFDYKHLDLKSILFPLMGTGTARGALEENARELIEEAIAYLLDNPQSCLVNVYFLNWTDKQLKTCERIIHESGELEDICLI